MRSQRGHSLVELQMAVTVMMVISGTMTSALLQITKSQRSIWNRTEMHSGIRGATELLQQEVGQAGRISLPGTVTLAAPVLLTGAQAVVVSSAAGMFVGERLTIDAGASQETVTLTAVNPVQNMIAAAFSTTHPNGAPVSVLGGFASGILPTTAPNGSTGTVLKLFGDINGDGSMMYVEYTCDTAAGHLYRNVMPFDAASKSGVTNAQVLLSGIQANPGGTPCFSYHQNVVGANTYVTDVAITLTIQTLARDATTNQFQTETKALLNVSPRNIFDVWALASLGAIERIQSMPPSVQGLLP